jgi:hypothetical protein
MSTKNLLALTAVLFVAAFGLVADSLVTHPAAPSLSLSKRLEPVSSCLTGGAARPASATVPGVAVSNLGAYSDGVYKDTLPTGIASLLREAHAVGVSAKYALIVNGPLGPNDGEPLKAGQGTFSIQTGFQDRGHMFVTGFQQSQTGTRFDFISSLAIPENPSFGAPNGGDRQDNSPLREIREQFDLSLYGHEEFNLSFYLMNEHFSEVVAHNHWRGRLVFPKMVYLPAEAERNPQKFFMLLDGRESDKEYVLVRGNVNQVESMQNLSPGKGYETLGDYFLTSGEFQDPGVAANGEARPYQYEMSLKLDTLFKIHGWNTVLILWTRHPQLGWARSAVMKPYDELMRAHMEKPPCEELVGVTACDDDQ